MRDQGVNSSRALTLDVSDSAIQRTIVTHLLIARVAAEIPGCLDYLGCINNILLFFSAARRLYHNARTFERDVSTTGSALRSCFQKWLDTPKVKLEADRSHRSCMIYIICSIPSIAVAFSKYCSLSHVTVVSHLMSLFRSTYSYQGFTAAVEDREAEPRREETCNSQSFSFVGSLSGLLPCNGRKHFQSRDVPTEKSECSRSRGVSR